MVPVSAVTTQMTSANQVKKRPSRGGGRFFPTCRGLLLGPASAVAGSIQVKERPFRGGGVRLVLSCRGFLLGPASAVTRSDDKRQPGQKKDGGGGDFF